MISSRFELAAEDIVAQSSWCTRRGNLLCLFLDATASYPKGSPVQMLSLLRTEQRPAKRRKECFRNGEESAYQQS